MQFDPDDTSDPVIATYDVFISDADAQRIVLQYPDRPADKVYNADSRQKPVELRIKPQTGIVEVEVPVDTNINYDVRKGLKYGNAMRQSRTMAEGGAMGMAGGFNVGGGVVAGDDGAATATKGRGKGKGKAAATEGMLEDGDVYDSDEDKKAGVRMMTQTLGGRIVPAVDGDPIYMLGAFKDNELHLSPLSGMVQLRPQLHHLDAMDEIQLKAKTLSRRGEGDDPGQPEARAIDLKVKSAEAKTGGQSNNDLLKRMQEERFEKYEWVDEADGQVWDRYEECMFNQNVEQATDLESSIGTNDYLDELSAPRVDPMYPELAGQMLKERRKHPAARFT